MLNSTRAILRIVFIRNFYFMLFSLPPDKEYGPEYQQQARQYPLEKNGERAQPGPGNQHGSIFPVLAGEP